MEEPVGEWSALRGLVELNLVEMNPARGTSGLGCDWIELLEMGMGVLDRPAHGRFRLQGFALIVEQKSSKREVLAA